VSDTIVKVGDVQIGGGRPVVIAGPCTVEDEAGLMETAKSVKNAGARMLRGGAFKTRTSPQDFQGLGEEGLKMLARARARFGLPVVTEITDSRDIDLISNYADMLQIGSRNMQNSALLKAAGRSRLPVLLKRGFACTVNEWLSAADYILSQGNPNVVLCERGIRSFEDSTRFSLDILSIAVVKKLSHLPIIVDPSHAAGYREYVSSAAKASIAAGADGLMIEVNNDPEQALVDSRQTMTTAQFSELMMQLDRLFEPG
jgi:3-deoxy-7-phosphoheptulonate synthase